jgi:hypothetical protein
MQYANGKKTGERTIVWKKFQNKQANGLFV